MHGGLNENCSPIGLGILTAASSWWNCLGSIWRCGLSGGSTSLGAGFEYISLHSTYSSFSPCFLSVVEMWAFTFLFQLPCLPLVTMPPHHDGLLFLWKCIKKVNFLPQIIVGHNVLSWGGGIFYVSYLGSN